LYTESADFLVEKPLNKYNAANSFKKVPFLKISYQPLQIL